MQRCCADPFTASNDRWRQRPSSASGGWGRGSWEQLERPHTELMPARRKISAVGTEASEPLRRFGPPRRFCRGCARRQHVSSVTATAWGEARRRRPRTLALDAGLTLVQMAIAFVTCHPAVTSAIIGPRTTEHRETHPQPAAWTSPATSSSASTTSCLQETRSRSPTTCAALAPRLRTQPSPAGRTTASDAPPAPCVIFALRVAGRARLRPAARVSTQPLRHTRSVIQSATKSYANPARSACSCVVTRDNPSSSNTLASTPIPGRRPPEQSAVDSTPACATGRVRHDRA